MPVQPAPQPTRLALGEVDPVQPLDPTSPLARGLQGFWLPLPHLSGGERLYDLSSYNNHGDISGAQWETTTESSLPHLNMDGDDNVPTGLSPSSDNLRTFALFFTIGAHNDKNRIGDGFGRFYLGDDNNNGFIWGCGSDFIFSNTPTNKSGVPVTLVGTFDGGIGTIGLDGNVENSSSNLSAPTSSSGFDLGTRVGGGGSSFTGRLYAALVSTTAWSATEIALWDNQARRGFPNLLRRRDESSLYVSSAGAITLSTNELRHDHTLGPTSVSAQYALTTDELQQNHALGASALSVGYSLTTAEMQQAHTLESPSLAIAGLLTPEDVQQGHTLESTLTDVQFALTTDALQQGHTLDASGVDVAYALTPQGLRHLHSLAPSTLQAIFGLTPQDLSQAHTIESPSGSGLVILSVDGMRHPHGLTEPVLGTVGFATKINVSASPVYNTTSSEQELYQITLDASPILE